MQLAASGTRTTGTACCHSQSNIKSMLAKEKEEYEIKSRVEDLAVCADRNAA